MAVPGSPLDPRASGPNHLIREGATLIRNADDVTEILMTFSGTSLREPIGHNADFSVPYTTLAPEQDIPENLQDRVLDQLSFTPLSVDELIRTCHVTISGLQSILLELELAGRIKRMPGNRVIRVEDA